MKVKVKYDYEKHLWQNILLFISLKSTEKRRFTVVIDRCEAFYDICALWRVNR